MPPSVTINGQTVGLTASSEYEVNETLYSGHVVDVVLEGQQDGGGSVVLGTTLRNITISWTDSGCVDEAAIEVTVIKENGNTRRITADACSRVPVNNFDLPTENPDRETVVNVNDTGGDDKLVRIKGFYAQTIVNVVGDEDGLPAQTTIVTAKAPVGADNTTRAVSVNKVPGSLPSIFDYVVFSGTTLVKN